MYARPALMRYPTAGAKIECSTAKASNVTPQILVGTRSLINRRASISPRVPRNVSFTRTTYLAMQRASSTTARPLAGDFLVVTEKNRSPRISYISWGRLEVEGRAEPYKDAKLFPGGSRGWNWRET